MQCASHAPVVRHLSLPTRASQVVGGNCTEPTTAAPATSRHHREAATATQVFSLPSRPPTPRLGPGPPGTPAKIEPHSRVEPQTMPAPYVGTPHRPLVDSTASSEERRPRASLLQMMSATSSPLRLPQPPSQQQQEQPKTALPCRTVLPPAPPASCRGDHCVAETPSFTPQLWKQPITHLSPPRPQGVVQTQQPCQPSLQPKRLATSQSRICSGPVTPCRTKPVVRMLAASSSSSELPQARMSSASPGPVPVVVSPIRCLERPTNRAEALSARQFQKSSPIATVVPKSATDATFAEMGVDRRAGSRGVSVVTAPIDSNSGSSELHDLREALSQALAALESTEAVNAELRERERSARESELMAESQVAKLEASEELASFQGCRLAALEESQRQAQRQQRTQRVATSRERRRSIAVIERSARASAEMHAELEALAKRMRNVESKGSYSPADDNDDDMSAITDLEKILASERECFATWTSDPSSVCPTVSAAAVDTRDLVRCSSSTPRQRRDSGANGSPSTVTPAASALPLTGRTLFRGSSFTLDDQQLRSDSMMSKALFGSAASEPAGPTASFLLGSGGSWTLPLVRNSSLPGSPRHTTSSCSLGQTPSVKPPHSTDHEGVSKSSSVGIDLARRSPHHCSTSLLRHNVKQPEGVQVESSQISGEIASSPVFLVTDSRLVSPAISPAQRAMLFSGRRAVGGHYTWLQPSSVRYHSQPPVSPLSRSGWVSSCGCGSGAGLS
eukprot:TRINITY_DN22394_c0_g1_i1.p1 TRINITY_DN22394_c0_g1~~TRINITY_DN22394_c0_g1_i1.p1  ORF type:complete len:835 (+),score=105.59 TRINITY_DN22394_c0_g1_i1:295-2505(+)